jgi:hypothetical protein
MSVRSIFCRNRVVNVVKSLFQYSAIVHVNSIIDSSTCKFVALTTIVDDAMQCIVIPVEW